MFCSRCGTEIAANAAFCSKCGAPTGAGVVAAPAKERSPIAIVFLVIALVLGGVMLLGIIAAIAVPGLLRARMSGNEASAIGSMRAIVSAEASYAASAGGGWYATSLATLARPCPSTSQGFIASDLAQDPSVKSGYTIRLESARVEPGPPDCNGVATEKDFYATAVPQTAGTTGRRAFSTSAAGTLFERPDGLPPSLEETLSGTAIPVR